MPQTDKKSKIFFIVLFLILCATVALTYYRIIIVHDYYIVEPEPAEETQ